MLDIIARIALFPVLAAQGWATRRRAKFLPEPSGVRRGSSGSGPDLNLLVLGDSSAAGVGVSHQDDALLGHLRRALSQNNTVHWQLEALTGRKTRETIRHLEAMPAAKFHIVSVSLGVNDVTGLVSARSWQADQVQMLDLLRDKYQADVICVSGVPKIDMFPLLPNPLRWNLGQQARRFNRILRPLLAGRPECRFVEMEFVAGPEFMSKDGFHPGPVIYEEWAGKVLAAIAEDLPALREG